MKKEIGSEFWNVYLRKNNRHFFLCGRTALDFIIRDILETESVNSVLLPSYCCHTMIEPFVRNGLQVRFYDIRYVDEVGMVAYLPDFRENEIFYYMTYFGYSKIFGLDREEIRNNYRIIIEDKTHSWLNATGHIDANYTYTSYRKWAGYSGIAEAEKNGVFSIVPEGVCCEAYTTMREKALDLKAEYILNGIGEKKEFLDLFGAAETLLEHEYVGYRPSYDAMENFLKTNWSQVKVKRRNNAEVLLLGLKKCNRIKLLFSELEESDVPLFVPILVPERDALRGFLIQNQIYCPAHWPLSSYHMSINERGKELYNQELSLVCDQRYDEADMQRIVEVILDFFEVK